MTLSTINRIDRLYRHWIGYAPIAEDGQDPAEALSILREFRLEAWGGKAPRDPQENNYGC